MSPRRTCPTTARTAVVSGVLLAGVLSLASWGPVTASAAARLNLTGTWKAVYHCKTGWCAGEKFPATDTLRQARGSNTVTGTNGTETISGTLSGHTLHWVSTAGSYRAEGTLALSSLGRLWSGPLHDSNGTSGTYTAARVPVHVRKPRRHRKPHHRKPHVRGHHGGKRRKLRPGTPRVSRAR